MKNSNIQLFSEIKSVTSLLQVKHIKTVPDFCIYSFEKEDKLNYSALNQFRQFYYELVIDITATCSFIIENEKFTPQKNKIILIKPFQLQSPLDQKDTKTPSLDKGFIMFFKPELLKNIHELEQLPIFDKRIVTSFSFTDNEMKFFEALANEIYSEYRTYNGIMSKKIIRNYLEIIFYKLQQISLTSIEVGYNNASKRIYYDFLHAVNQNFQRLTTVKEYAQLLNVTPRHLSEAIKAESNIHALAIINQTRLSHSKILLQQTNKTINEIAHDLKFFDANNFSTYFKKHTKTTPLQFRKNQS